MSIKISQYFKSFWHWLGASSPDVAMEKRHKEFGVRDPSPVWYNLFSKVLGYFLVAVAITIPLILHIKFGSPEGSELFFRLFLVALTPILLLLQLVAVIHKKYRYSKSLPSPLKDEYIGLITHRVKRFFTIFFVTLIVAAIFTLALLFVDKITAGSGWF